MNTLYCTNFVYLCCSCLHQQQSGMEKEREKAERVARLQQYRQGVWELNFDFHAFERWRRVGAVEGLTSDTEIACFLLHQ